MVPRPENGLKCPKNYFVFKVSKMLGGRCPRAAGRCPRAAGRCPRAAGRCPRAAGLCSTVNWHRQFISWQFIL